MITAPWTTFALALAVIRRLSCSASRDCQLRGAA